MTTKNLSRELCEICGIEGKIIEDYDGNEYEIFPDFEQPENYKRLQEIFIDNGHSITLSEDWFAISNGDIDFVTDMYDTSFSIKGKTFLNAVCNYLALWIEEQTQIKLQDNTMSPPIDTSHKLTREGCIYPRGYDDLLKDIEKIKQAIKSEVWEYE